MISYAQNFEDVMLARALESVERGFYIDIGAWHPDRHSVTRHFYELGWNGINVEPGRTYFSLLKRRRPRDLNLNLAVSSHLGPVRFHEHLARASRAATTQCWSRHAVTGSQREPSRPRPLRWLHCASSTSPIARSIS